MTTRQISQLQSSVLWASGAWDQVREFLGIGKTGYHWSDVVIYAHILTSQPSLPWSGALIDTNICAQGWLISSLLGKSRSYDFGGLGEDRVFSALRYGKKLIMSDYFSYRVWILPQSSFFHQLERSCQILVEFLEITYASYSLPAGRKFFLLSFAENYSICQSEWNL